jgi:hypothetical protein
MLTTYLFWIGGLFYYQRPVGNKANDKMGGWIDGFT